MGYFQGPSPTIALTMLVIANSPACAESYATTNIAERAAKLKLSTVSEPGQRSPFLPPDFAAPTRVETATFKIVPLGPALVKVDFDAYMSSIDHLQKTFTRSTDWPHANISHADALRDMETEWTRFRNRESFAYAVLTPDGRRERGSVYVAPSSVDGFDAVVRMWVTKSEHEAGFDAELYKWVARWIQKDWPFRKVAYPGRSIDWATWDSMIAASPPRKADAEGQQAKP